MSRVGARLAQPKALVWRKPEERLTERAELAERGLVGERS
jgi:hypothetical protein